MVNQLLAKIDGVEQLNNILVIGKPTSECVDIESYTIKVGGGGKWGKLKCILLMLNLRPRCCWC